MMSAKELNIDELANRRVVRKGLWGMRRLYFPLWRCLLGLFYDIGLNTLEIVKTVMRVSPPRIDPCKFDDYRYLWSRLACREDRERLSEVMACRILKRKNVYFEQNVACYAALYKKLKALHYRLDRSNFISKVHVSFRDVFGEGFVASLEMDTCTLGSLACGQYRHPEIHPEKGDVCIDFGSYMGETSLLMAELVGDGGKVYAVEFGENYALLKNNLANNPQLAPRIVGIDQPFWSEAGKNVYVSGEGTNAKVEFTQPQSGNVQQFTTQTLDSACARYQMQKIDFIKMDVEGAEYPILLGCKEAIQRHKPKLAISIYHGDEDFDRIPRLIDSWGCGYEYRIGHYSSSWTETILYAVAKK